MFKVYLITKNVKGPAGHGEPGEPYLALATDGVWFDLGNPLPAFPSFDTAEVKRKEFDDCNRYKVTELEIEVYACHADSCMPIPDPTCVWDEQKPEECDLASQGIRKKDCECWRIVK